VSGPLSLIAWPLRVGLRAGGAAVSLARHLVPSGSSSAEDAPAPVAATQTTARRPDTGVRRSTTVPAPVVEDRPPAPPHVSEEPEPVATVADPGAEAGAGAELEIAQPWEGYDRMQANEIMEQLSVASVEAAAAVRLYEAAGQSRIDVLDAAEARLRRG
jgi:hypothetical protein